MEVIFMTKKNIIEALVWIVTISVLLSMTIMAYRVRRQVAQVEEQYANGWQSCSTQILKIANVTIGYSRNAEYCGHTNEAKACGVKDNGFWVAVYE
jgi:type II secretory pathway component PulL